MRRRAVRLRIALPSLVAVCAVALCAAGLVQASPVGRADPTGVTASCPATPVASPTASSTPTPIASVSPSPTSTPSPSATPSPTPSASPTGGASASAIPGPTAPPCAVAPSPTSVPGPTHPPVGLSSPPASAAKNAPGHAPPVAKPAAAAALPASSLNAFASLTFRGAPGIDQLQGILRAPISGQRPPFAHFASAAVPPSKPPSAGAGGAPANGNAATGLGLVLCLALGAIVVAAGARRRVIPSPGWWRRRRGVRVRPVIAATAGVGALLSLLAISAAAGGPHRAPTTSPPSAVAAHVHPLASSRPGSSPPASSGVWAQLLAADRSAQVEEQRLTQLEGEMRPLAASIAAGGPASPQLSAATAAPALPAPLDSLLKAHQTAEAAYTTTLKQEFSLFLQVAASSGERADVLAQAAGTPRVSAAVAGDISLVELDLAQEKALADASAKAKTLGVALASSAGAGNAEPAFAAPLSGLESQPFGPTDLAMEPPMLFQGILYPHFHTGIDIAAPLLTPVHAAAPGVVVEAGPEMVNGQLVGFGNFVIVAHAGGYMSLYGHLDKILVNSGQHVAQGTVIGLEGSTGNSTGPHVHFEIRHNGELLDPAIELARTRATNALPVAPPAAPPATTFSVGSDLTAPSGLSAATIDAFLSGTALEGLGATFVAAEAADHISARFLVADAVLASNWGTRALLAQTHNPLGYGVNDVYPTAATISYASDAQGVAAAAQQIAQEYVASTGPFFHGTTLQGVSVALSSDPLWADKIALIADALP